MADRKAELERKRKRLEEMRRQRGEKEKSKGEKSSSTSGSQSEATTSPSVTKDIDELLQGIDLPNSMTGSSTKQQKEVEIRPADKDVTTLSPGTRQKAVKLSVVTVNSTNIPPKEPVLYSKETQTVVIEKPPEDFDDEPKVVLSKPEEVPNIKDEEESKKAKEERIEEVAKILELSEEQRTRIVQSQDFTHFVERTARLMEKAISENVDICFDYGGSSEEAEGHGEAAARLTLNRQFYDDRWSKHRCVTCMDWSTQYPELLVASYNQNEAAPQDPDGVALIWNMKFNKSSPEYVLHNQSPIMSVCFAKFHPNLIVGGAYSGQIVLWDDRSSKRTPVQRTPLSTTAHTHPVYCVNVVGTQNAHNLITVSTDGRMCSWSLDMLSQPQEIMEFQYKQSKSIAVTSMSFAPGDINNFVVGSEDGSVYTGQRHSNKAGLVDYFTGHSGPITGIDYHTVQGQMDFSHLFLTSSFDWTVKLWSNKSSKPLYAFEDNGDYVYDVQWSPVHPALFATVDGMGKLDLWNLNNDTEVPTTSVSIDSSAAINRVRWTANGQQIATGDDDGHIYIYDVGEQLAQPRPDEWSRFMNTLHELQVNSTSVLPSEGTESKSMSPTSFITPPRI